MGGGRTRNSSKKETSTSHKGLVAKHFPGVPGFDARHCAIDALYLT